MIIYDISGRQVAVLLNKPMAPGKYEIDFNANTISSGVYYCMLSVGDPFYEPSGSKNRGLAPLRITKKMMLVK